MHRFRITVEPLTPGDEAVPLQFEADCHDDMVAIARRMKGRFDLDDESSKAFAIGMKLFGEVILKNRARLPFRELRPAWAEFMKAVKAARSPEAGSSGTVLSRQE